MHPSEHIWPERNPAALSNSSLSFPRLTSFHPNFHLLAHVPLPAAPRGSTSGTCFVNCPAVTHRLWPSLGSTPSLSGANASPTTLHQPGDV